MAAEMQPRFERAIAYNTAQFTQGILPAFRKMLSLFQDKLPLVEESTQAHCSALVEFVEVWNRVMADAISRTLPEKIGHGAEALQELYDDAEGHRARLVAGIRRGKGR